MVAARIFLVVLLAFGCGAAFAADVPAPVLDFLKSQDFEIRISNGSRLVGEKTLPEGNSWTNCPPAYYEFADAGVIVEIDNGSIYTRFWERRAHTNRFTFVRDCELSGALEAKLRDLLAQH